MPYLRVLLCKQQELGLLNELKGKNTGGFRELTRGLANQVQGSGQGTARGGPAAENTVTDTRAGQDAYEGAMTSAVDG